MLTGQDFTYFHHLSIVFGLFFNLFNLWPTNTGTLRGVVTESGGMRRHLPETAKIYLPVSKFFINFAHVFPITVMKNSFLTAAAICTAAIPMLFASCSKGDTSDASAGKADAAISEFAVNQSIKSSDRTYLVTFDGDSAYFDISTSIHWPEKIGNADIKVLQDSLLRYCYADTSKSVNPAILDFIANTSMVDSLAPGETITAVEAEPAARDEMRSWYSNVTASTVELNEEMVSYEVSSSTYTGGAHPFTATRPFTYDLRNAKVLDLGNMFVPGSTDKLVGIIKGALARQLGVDVSKLDNAGIFASQLTYPGQPYIAGGGVVFHYNPYDIAPYAMGPVDVTVYPYEIDSILNPDVKTLFADQF